MVRAEHMAVVAKHGAVGPREHHREGARRGILGDTFSIRALPQGRGQKFRIKRRSEFGLYGQHERIAEGRTPSPTIESAIVTRPRSGGARRPTRYRGPP